MHMSYTLCTCYGCEETRFSPLPQTTAFTPAQGFVVYRHGFGIPNVFAYMQTPYIDMVLVFA